MFPTTIFILQKPDGTLAVFDNEASVPAPLDVSAPMGTYTLVKTEAVQRIITLDKKPTIIGTKP